VALGKRKSTAVYAGFARLNFATPAAILREIVTRMGEAVKRH
jgi:bifunctional pyridoxal-dependent enzyme with beta-cystathionase and maltose regulon repressor activities